MPLDVIITHAGKNLVPKQNLGTSKQLIIKAACEIASFVIYSGFAI